MWIANLSNGSVEIEQEPVPGEPSSWQKLLARCRETGIEITGLRLTDGQRVMVSALPHKMCDGYFHAYEATRYLFKDIERLKQGIGSIVGNNVYITWVEPADNNLTYIWTEVRPLNESIVHTTLNEVHNDRRGTSNEQGASGVTQEVGG